MVKGQYTVIFVDEHTIRFQCMIVVHCIFLCNFFFSFKCKHIMEICAEKLSFAFSKNMLKSFVFFS